MAVQNRNKVPKKQWTKWNKKEVRLLFNILYEAMLDRPEDFRHRKAEAEGPINQKYWGVTAWNAAWTAASILNNILYPED